jgi:hypothetical protein
MTARESVARLLAPIFEWLAGRLDPWDMDLEYWRIRRELMAGGEVFDGPPAQFLSNIDTAMDSFSPEPDRSHPDIDEAQLRAEIEVAIARLRDLGYAE